MIGRGVTAYWSVMQRTVVTGIVAAMLVSATNANAWVAHEHFRITELGVQELPGPERAELDELWRALRERPGQLCKDAATPERGDDGFPTCVTFPMLPALAADHSCSPAELDSFVDKEAWILQVLRVAAETERNLHDATNDRHRIDAWNGMHLSLERVDRGYTSRAVANDAHFLLARRTGDLDAYLRDTLKPKQHVNSAAMYALYHLAALRAARAYAGARDPKARADLARDVLLSESFALHFLEDSFAAGHLVGAWGGNATKMGTHNLYSQRGIDAFTWEKETYSAHGDAFLAEVDRERTGRAVKDSLAAILAVARGAPLATAVEAAPLPTAFDYDVCTAITVGVPLPETAVAAYVAPAWAETPMPSSPREQTPPVRGRAELGPFVSFQSGGGLSAMFGGYQSPEPGTPRMTFSLSAMVGFGYGLEGITTSGGDGTFYLDVGVDAQSVQFDDFCSSSCVDERSPGSVVPRVPARVGYQARLRMPFWLIPGDLLVAGPFVYLISPRDLTKMGILAADGGLIPWQRVLPTAIGDFQFVVGRQIGVTWFDMNNDDQFFSYAGTDASGHPVHNPTRVRSLLFEFPIVEYRPFRAFNERLGSSLTAQLGVGFEAPNLATPERTDLPPVRFDDTFVLFLRIFFDGRAYL